MSTAASIADIIRQHAGARPAEVAMVYGDSEMSWQALHDRSARVAQALLAEGVVSQDHVSFLDKNGPAFFEFQFGCSMANVINVPVNWRLAPSEIEYTVNDAEAKVLVVGPEFFESVEQIEARLSTVTKIVALGDHPKWESFDDWLSGRDAVDPGATSAPNDVALQLYTSGTTGLPKGVMLTNSNVFSLFANVSGPWGLTAADAVNLVAMPLYHIGGVGWGLAGMFSGCRTVLVREFIPDQVLDILMQRGVTTALFVPAMLSFMSLVPGAADRTYPIRTIVYGASPITNETLLAAMRTFKCDFFQVYGMTETTGAFNQLDSVDHDPDGPRAHLLRSAGRPYPWVELRVVELDGSGDCGVGVVGEVWTRSAQNMAGYWAKPEATASTVTADGWLKTGDAGYLDAEGFLFLTDRVKDMIVSGGENVYPAEVENVLASHPAIAEVAVIGVPSERWGETVKAVVVLRAGMSATAAELLTFSKGQLAGFKCPTSVDFIAALPRNPTGKVLKKDLREPYWAGQARRIN